MGSQTLYPPMPSSPRGGRPGDSRRPAPKPAHEGCQGAFRSPIGDRPKRLPDVDLPATSRPPPFVHFVCFVVQLNRYDHCGRPRAGASKLTVRPGGDNVRARGEAWKAGRRSCASNRNPTTPIRSQIALNSHDCDLMPRARLSRAHAFHVSWPAFAGSGITTGSPSERRRMAVCRTQPSRFNSTAKGRQ